MWWLFVNKGNCLTAVAMIMVMLMVVVVMGMDAAHVVVQRTCLVSGQGGGDCFFTGQVNGEPQALQPVVGRLAHACADEHLAIVQQGKFGVVLGMIMTMRMAVLIVAAFFTQLSSCLCAIFQSKHLKIVR